MPRPRKKFGGSQTLFTLQARKQSCLQNTGIMPYVVLKALSWQHLVLRMLNQIVHPSRSVFPCHSVILGLSGRSATGRGTNNTIPLITHASEDAELFEQWTHWIILWGRELGIKVLSGGQSGGVGSYVWAWVISSMIANCTGDKIRVGGSLEDSLAFWLALQWIQDNSSALVFLEPGWLTRRRTETIGPDNTFSQALFT